MTSFEMDAMLKIIRVERKGGRLLKFPPVKMLWFDELSKFNTKGEK